MRYASTILALLLVLNLLAGSAWACASCPCSFNSEWAAEGLTSEPGLRFDVRYDYISQSQLRSGGDSVAHGDFEFPTDREVPQRTITRATLVGLDYAPVRDWGFRAVMPIIDRTHTTIMSGEEESIGSSTLGLGDVQLIARYQGFTPEANLGIQFGLKLPSGAFTDTFDTHTAAEEEVHSADEAGLRHAHGEHEVTEPERLDRGLQNGTGTTDLILGVYKFGTLAERADYFLQILANQPAIQRSAFRSGTALTSSAGVGYKITDWMRPQVQLSYRVETREEGDLADRANSGGEFLKITPGVSFFATKDLTMYALVELPLTQRVNGLQLHPHSIMSAGLRYSF